MVSGNSFVPDDELSARHNYAEEILAAEMDLM